MNYLVEYCEKKFPDVATFASELSHVPPASKGIVQSCHIILTIYSVSVSTLPADLRELCKPIDALKNEIAAVGRVEVPDGDRFIACFTV